MKLEVMAIYDGAAAAYLPPFCVASEAIAIRELKKLGAEQPKHDFVRYADQYTLYSLGSFDNESGKLHAMNPNSISTLQVIFAKASMHE